MKIFKVAIVGRANVGKSSLFNAICKKKISIVHEQEGVTRDRIYSLAYFNEEPFYVIDTAGLEIDKSFSLIDEITIQTQIAIEEADFLIMVVDGQIGLTNLDEIVAKNLLKTKKKVVLAINKIDSDKFKDKVYQFQSLGFQNNIEISCSQNYNIDDLLQLVFQKVTFDENYQLEKVKKSKIAIIGRTNVGKSTLLNALLCQKRAVVSDSLATTRDSIDVDISKNNKIYTFIDTAGIRRKSKESDVIEKFSHSITLKRIEEADICILMIDSQDFLTTQDKKILKVIEKENKGCLILVNKWDTMKNVRQEHFIKAIKQNFSFPVLIISALKKMNIDKIFSMIDKIEKNQSQLIQTSQLNKFIEKCIKKYHPPMIKGKRLKIYYVTQIKNNPPHFLFFVNQSNIFNETYKKYLINALRETFDFEGSQIIFEIKQKNQN